MQENLLSPTNIILFGRLFPLSVDAASLPAALGANQFLRHQLADGEAKFARIYAFSYEGSFFNLPRPAVYLVHTEGREVKGAGLPARGKPDAQQPTISDSGLVALDFDFEHDVRYWEYDKGDFTLRIDIASGTFDEILLEAALSLNARDALVSRSDMTARSDMASRSDMTSRSDVAARHKLKS